MTHRVRSYFFPHGGSNYDRWTAFCLRSYFFPHGGKKYDRTGGCQ